MGVCVCVCVCFEKCNEAGEALPGVGKKKGMTRNASKQGSNECLVSILAKTSFHPSKRCSKMYSKKARKKSSTNH